MMKHSMKIQLLGLCLVAVVISGLLTGCSTDPGDTGMEYAPNMFISQPLEPYTQLEPNKIFKDGLNAQSPPENTLARSSWLTSENYERYQLKNTTEDYLKAGETVRSPLTCNDETLARGQRHYETFCIVCHGATGAGDGILTIGSKPGAERGDGPYPPPPAYNTLQITEGNMFHSVTYGKNNMGSYASQLTPKERWEVICYIKKFFPNATPAQASVAVDK